MKSLGNKGLILGGVSVAALLLWQGRAVADAVNPSAYPTGGQTLNVEQAKSLFNKINVEMGLWFGWNGYGWRDVVAMWQIESALNPRAVGDDGTSFGIGQVQRPTANDIGVTGDLLDPYHGGKASMLYLKELKRLIQSKNGGRSVTFGQLVMAYNGGIGNYWRGTLPAFTVNVHLPKWENAKAKL